ncbi:MAG: UTP--glucose-1-phosphate uridylyltransferase [Chlamydiales bacterium]
MLTSVVAPNPVTLHEEYRNLSTLVEELKQASSVAEKLRCLDSFSLVKEFLLGTQPLKNILLDVDEESELVVKALIAIGQAERVFALHEEQESEKIHSLIKELLEVERFYEEIGGLVGYHFLMLERLLPEASPTSNACYSDPEAIDISEESGEVRHATIRGIEKLDEMAEIYPVGGAADRLNLQDARGTPLPAAKLPFHGKTLLEGLITDLQAREYLHYKLFNKQLCTPLVMMTSCEKDNHAQILLICDEKKWFGRPKDSFLFISQPSVPSMNTQGEWCMQGPLQLLLKPSGHGVIWKLAQRDGAFEWLASKGRKKALVRQINNPLAGIDYGLLAFTGVGCLGNKVFGFASCPRKAGAPEGVNVLLERPVAKGVEYLLTNVEYTDLQKLSHAGFAERKFANTNILFVDLKAVERAVQMTPFPGVLINPKKMRYQKEGKIVEEEVARLESTMQNIADCFAEFFPRPLPVGKRRDAFKAFITFNQRKKTISTVKRADLPGSPLAETPEGCFLDQMENAKELLAKYCQMKLQEDKPLLVSYHPALGPLFSIIAQKVRGGKINGGSELQLQIAELDMENLDLDGSLSIMAENVVGHAEKDEVLTYSQRTGKCVLKNVRVTNAGVDWKADHFLWKGEVKRKERCEILIRGDGELYAENVTFSGSLEIDVEAGMRLTVTQGTDGTLSFHEERIAKPQPLWKYTLTNDDRILLIPNIRKNF